MTLSKRLALNKSECPYPSPTPAAPPRAAPRDEQLMHRYRSQPLPGPRTPPPFFPAFTY
jgi:hypothetical protein